MGHKEGVFERILLFVGSVVLVGMVVVVIAQIFYRFILLRPLSWSEELARGFFIWSVVIGTAIAMGGKLHTNLTVFIDKFSPGLRIFMLSLTTMAMIFFLVVVFAEGIKLTILAQRNTSAVLKLPMGYFYASVPTACGIMAIYSVWDLIRLWWCKKEGRGENE